MIDFVVGVTILLSLTVFLLLVAETMPPTSDAVPLIGRSPAVTSSANYTPGRSRTCHRP